MKVCANCSSTVKVEGGVTRSSTCDNCGAYLHSCVNCKFYAPGKENDCREPQSEHARDKNSANFCEYFVFTESNPQQLSDAVVLFLFQF